MYNDCLQFRIYYRIGLFEKATEHDMIHTANLLFLHLMWNVRMYVQQQ